MTKLGQIVSNTEIGSPIGTPLAYANSLGSDSNDGLSLATPKQTLQAAYNALPSSGGAIIGVGDFDVYNGGTGLVISAAKPARLIGGTGGGSQAWPFRLFSSGALEALVTLDQSSSFSNTGQLKYEGVFFDLGTTAIYGMKAYAWTHTIIERCKVLGSNTGTGRAAYPQYLLSTEIGDNYTPHGDDNSWFRVRDCYCNMAGLHKAGDFVTTTASVSVSTSPVTINVVPGSIAKWPNAGAITGTPSLGNLKLAAPGVVGDGGVLANVNLTYTGKSAGNDQLLGVTAQASYGPFPAGTMIGRVPASNCNQHIWESNIVGARSGIPAAIDLWGATRCASFGNNLEGPSLSVGIRLHRARANAFIGDGGESVATFIQAIGDSGTGTYANTFIPLGDVNANTNLVLDDGPQGNTLIAPSDQQIYVDNLPVTTLQAANYQIKRADKLVRMDTTAAGRTTTLPSPVGAWGEEHTIRNEVGANNVTVATLGGAGVVGGTTIGVGASGTYMSNGSDWYKVIEAGATVAADTIWDTKGDLAVATAADTAAKLPVGTNFKDRLIADSTTTTGLRWVPHIIRKTADETVTNSITLQNDDHLLFPVAANEIWFVQAWLIITAANATMDFKAAWSVPSGTTMLWGALGPPNSNFGSFGFTTSGSTALALFNETTTTSTFGTPANATMGGSLAAVVTAGATPGNVNLQWAQGTADAGNLTVKTNSFLQLTRLA